MRSSSFLLTLCLSALFLFTMQGQNQLVNLRLNMRGQNVSPQGVSVAGNFQSLLGGTNWTPGQIWLTDSDGDSIYEIQLQLPQGRYFYKYINGNSWASTNEQLNLICGEDDGGGNINRVLIVGKNGANLPAHRFDDCEGQVVFQVNMSQQTPSSSGVFVTGDWLFNAGYGNAWETDALPMFDPDGDGIFRGQAFIQDSIPSRFLYYNGQQAEQPIGNCLSPTALIARHLQTSFQPQVLPAVCFDSCSTCSSNLDTNFRLKWWNDAVFYEIFVRSFYDSDGNGIGDFKGLTAKLDYLNDGNPNTQTDLGVDGIWLMPINSSPSYHGYDVTNYSAINPQYGTMADFEAFLDSAHTRGIKVIMDYVMNHSSSQHPWFQSAAASVNSLHRNKYIWRSSNPGFTGPWGQTVWHSSNNQFYYGLFWGGMPDLNYDEPSVKTELLNAAQFWLSKGVDGFRLDAIKYLDEDFPVLENTPETFQIIEDFKQAVLSENPSAYTVGEVWSSTSNILPYVDSTLLDQCFEFDLASRILQAVNQSNATGLHNHLTYIQEAYNDLQFAPFLTNHDQDRVFSVLNQDWAKMKQAAALLMAMPGTPFMYYGEELGLTGTGAHENIRRPMPWAPISQGGFTTGSPWQALGSGFMQNNVQTALADSNSLLNYYIKLINLRKGSDALRRGYSLILESTQTSLVAIARIYKQDAILILSNTLDQNLSPIASLSWSGLQPGNYVMVDMLTLDTLGPISVNASGGFALNSMQPLSGRQTRFIRLINENFIGLPIEPIRKVWRIFPNPANNYLNLEAPNTDLTIITYQILNLSGQKVLSGNLNKNEMQIPISSLKTGWYVIDVSQGADFSFKQKFWKE